jgi:hypothetical protein
MYLVPGLFTQPAVQERYKTDPPEGKERDRLKRFTAKCNLKIIGKLGGVRVRWLATGTWSAPLFWVAPILGGVLGALAYRVVGKSD